MSDPLCVVLVMLSRFDRLTLGQLFALDRQAQLNHRSVRFALFLFQSAQGRGIGVSIEDDRLDRAPHAARTS